LLSQLDRSLAAINHEVGTTPFVRLQLRLAPIVETCRQLVRADEPGLRTELVLVATGAYALAARLAFETGDDATAMALYEESGRLAGRLEDRSHLAAVRRATRWSCCTQPTTSTPR
jgi:hypothetical protein